MTDNRELFTAKAEDYARFRPSYPAAAVEWLRERMSGGAVADIGAGTGIFTRLLQGHFDPVYAVEPNAAMRAVFRRSLPDVPCLDGSGEHTGLPEGSVELITVAQAFHWLDEELFKGEARRILMPNGKVAIIWNSCVKNEFTLARDEVCKRYCPRFRAGHAGKRSAAEGDAFLREVYFSRVEVASFDNPFVMDLTAFLGNMRSRSYALAPGDAGFAGFEAELQKVFARFSENGIVTEPQRTEIYLGSFD